MSKVFINSLPKSGTHLLAKAVELFGYKEYSSSEEYTGDTPKFLNFREAKKALQKASSSSNRKNGDKINIGVMTDCFVDTSLVTSWFDIIPERFYILGHIPWTPHLQPIFAELNCLHLCIVRDPRAVIASQLSFILNTGKMPEKHFLEENFKNMSYKQRVNFILTGGYASTVQLEIKSFAAVFHSILAWRNEQGCLLVRFEDLIGEQGGGSAEQQKKTVQQIASHVGKPFSEDVASNVKKIFNPSSRTFRTGSIEGWKGSIDLEILEILTAYCKPLCIESGYEI